MTKCSRADGCAVFNYTFLTSKERDTETGLDYFGARYYSSTQGRFTSPDQPFMDQEEGDPQSWNLYSYVRNNPLNFTDPTGEGRWKDIKGELHWVGDEDGEYDSDLKASWVADENNPIGGYWDFGGSETVVPIPRPDDFAMETWPGSGKWTIYEFEPPMGGGLRNVTKKAPSIARGLSALIRRVLGKGVPKGLGELFKAGRNAKASEIAEWAKAQGWTARQTPNGPLKFIDENGVVRVTLKSGSSRAPGSNLPHVEIRNAAGQRVDPSGNPVTRTSPSNHTPIQWDW